MIVINGKKIAKRILGEQKALIAKYQLKPKLVTILVGNDEASRIYINEKRKKARKIRVDFQNFCLPADVPQKKLIDLIEKLNNDKDVSGIILQFPISKSLDADTIIKTINPKKDADGFHPENIRRFLDLDNLDDILHKNLILPVTPAAIMEILNVIARDPNLGTSRNDVAIIAKPSIFITPLIHYFTKIRNWKLEIRNFITVSPGDPNLAKKSKQADILITACGKPGFIKGEMVKDGAIVIDVGISRINGKVMGDVDFGDVAPKTRAITPVPGGIGPVTVAILLRNVIYASSNYYS
jgi:methylenetetrahydrofolate dehydrogenase (NADP+)/methenyltetrahydrofolate cyclohydrolase